MRGNLHMPSSWWSEIKSGLLDRPLYQARTQTTRACLHALLNTASQIHVNYLQVNQPAMASATVGVTDPISSYWTTPTEIAFSSHKSKPPLFAIK